MRRTELPEALRAVLTHGEPSGRVDVSDWVVEWSAAEVVVRNDDWRTALRPGDDADLPVAVQLARGERARTGWWAELTGDEVEHLLAVELRIDGRHRLELAAPVEIGLLDGLGRLDTTGFQIETDMLLGLLGALVACGANLLVDDGRW